MPWKDNKISTYEKRFSMSMMQSTTLNLIFNLIRLRTVSFVERCFDYCYPSLPLKDCILEKDIVMKKILKKILRNHQPGLKEDPPVGLIGLCGVGTSLVFCPRSSLLLRYPRPETRFSNSSKRRRRSSSSLAF